MMVGGGGGDPHLRLGRTADLWKLDMYQDQPLHETAPKNSTGKLGNKTKEG